VSASTFEWDPAKAAANLQAHGVSFEEAATVFQDPLAKIHADPDHSEGEDRAILMGHFSAGRLLLVSFTDRQDRIRLISARATTRREHKEYEKSQQEGS
jgi:uncharacterized DUF497 family protein